MMAWSMPHQSAPLPAPLPHDAPTYVRRPGPASSYSPALGAHICARIAGGESGAAICAHPEMPSKKTLHLWVRRHPDFAAAYRQARAQAAAEARAIDRDRAEARRWRMAREGRRTRGGPPSTYSPALAQAVCERIAQGETPRMIGADPAMPSCATIYAWLKTQPGFCELYAQARARQAEAKFDLAWEIALAATPRTVAVARLQCDVLRWQAALLAPRKYGRPEPEPPEPVTVVIRKFDFVDGKVVEI